MYQSFLIRLTWFFVTFCPLSHLYAVNNDDRDFVEAPPLSGFCPVHAQSVGDQLAVGKTSCTRALPNVRVRAPAAYKTATTRIPRYADPLQQVTQLVARRNVFRHLPDPSNQLSADAPLDVVSIPFAISSRLPLAPCVRGLIDRQADEMRTGGLLTSVLWGGFNAGTDEVIYRAAVLMLAQRKNVLLIAQEQDISFLQAHVEWRFPQQMTLVFDYEKNRKSRQWGKKLGGCLIVGGPSLLKFDIPKLGLLALSDHRDKPNVGLGARALKKAGQSAHFLWHMRELVPDLLRVPHLNVEDLTTCYLYQTPRQSLGLPWDENLFHNISSSFTDRGIKTLLVLPDRADIESVRINMEVMAFRFTHLSPTLNQGIVKENITDFQENGVPLLLTTTSVIQPYLGNLTFNALCVVELRYIPIDQLIRFHECLGLNGGPSTSVDITIPQSIIRRVSQQ